MLRIAALAVLALALAAGDPPMRPPELPPVVFIPTEKVERIDPAKHGVLMPYERFLEIWKKLEQQPTEKPPAPGVAAAIDQLQLQGRVVGEVAEFTMTGVAVGVAERWSAIALPAGLPLAAFQPADPRVVVERKGSALAMHLPGPGRYPFTATLTVPVAREVSGRRTLSVEVPDAASGRLELHIGDKHAEVTATPAVAATQVPVEDGVRFLAVLGAQRTLALAWQPPVQQEIGRAHV